jgi:hypothetical protein
MERDRAIKLIGWICEIANLPEPIFPPHDKYGLMGNASESGTGSCEIISISPESQNLLDRLREGLSDIEYKKHEDHIIRLENPPTPKPSLESEVYLSQKQIAWVIYFSENLKNLITSKDHPKLQELINTHYKTPSKTTAQQIFRTYTNDFDTGKAKLSTLLNEVKDRTGKLKPIVEDLEKVIESDLLKRSEKDEAKKYLVEFILQLNLLETDK